MNEIKFKDEFVQIEEGPTVVEDENEFEPKQPKSLINIEYLKYVYSIVDKVHVLRLEQLILFMKGEFPSYRDEKLLEIILETQKQNYILLTKDGYVTTNNYYKMISEDKFNDGIEINDYYCRLKINFGPQIKKEKKLIDCLTVVSKMIPYSKDFFIPNKFPWQVCFTVPDEFIETDEEGETTNSVLYQVCYISHAGVMSFREMLLQNFDIYDDESKEHIKRIAVLEDPEDAKLVPYVGFTKLVVVDGMDYDIVENRDEPWE